MAHAFAEVESARLWTCYDWVEAIFYDLLTDKSILLCLAQTLRSRLENLNRSWPNVPSQEFIATAVLGLLLRSQIMVFCRNLMQGLLESKSRSPIGKCQCPRHPSFSTTCGRIDPKSRHTYHSQAAWTYLSARPCAYDLLARS